MISAKVPRLSAFARALEQRVRDRIAGGSNAAAPGPEAWRRADWLWPTFTSEQ